MPMSNTRLAGRLTPSATLIAIAIAVAIGGGLRPSAQQPPAAPQQPTDVELVISGDGGTPPRYAVPDFIAVTPDMAEVAKVIGPVLFDDLAFERDVTLVARDVVATVPAARAADQVPFNSWREDGADAVIFGSVQRSGNTVSVQVRLFNVRTRQQVFGQEYTGPTTNPRGFAHRIADDIHKQQRNLRGVAQSKIAFVSDRARTQAAGVRRKDVKEIYISDYDGANQRRATLSTDMHLNPNWTPDGSGIAYSSWDGASAGRETDIVLSFLYKGVREVPTKGVGSNFHPAFSPDGSQIAFTSNRDGDSEIYVMNRDGGNVRRLTNNNAIDSSPTWSPGGTQIAFVSNRASPLTPRLYLMNADGSSQRPVNMPGGHVDKPTWAPAPYNEIAFSARVGGGFDIHVYDIATQAVRSVTSGEGSNESPAYSANGKHIAFSSTRQGRAQIFTIGRDGKGVRQITREGTNTLPAWSN
jgi:TolB protein